MAREHGGDQRPPAHRRTLPDAVDVNPIPGLEHLPFAEVWFHDVDEERWHEVSERAAQLGKTGLEVWTTDRTPHVAAFFAERGYEEVRRYVVSELDVAAAAEPGPPAVTIVTLADRPDLAPQLYELARVAHADQPGRPETAIGEAWHDWGLGAHPPEAYFIALDGERAIGYGYLEHEGDEWRNGFMAVARDHRGRGVAGAIKRAQIAWAKAHGVPALRTANEVRLHSMLALNRRIGYRPLYDEIVLRGPLATTEAAARANAVSLMRMMIAQNAKIHYPAHDVRTMTVHGISTRAQLEAAIMANTLTIDCSQSVTLIAHVAGAKDPNGGNFSSDGYTGTLLSGCEHITRAQAKPGDLRVFGGGTGHHVAMVLQAGPDPLLFSHGQERGPVAVSESSEARFQPPGGTFLRLPV